MEKEGQEWEVRKGEEKQGIGERGSMQDRGMDKGNGSGERGSGEMEKAKLKQRKRENNTLRVLSPQGPPATLVCVCHSSGSISVQVSCITESSSIMNHELFFTAWPIVSSWLRDQYIKAINQRRLRNLRLAVFNAWVEEARVFPPPLVSSSDDD